VHAGARVELLTKGRVKIVERISGTLLIVGGLWMAVSERASSPFQIAQHLESALFLADISGT